MFAAMLQFELKMNQNAHSGSVRRVTSETGASKVFHSQLDGSWAVWHKSPDSSWRTIGSCVTSGVAAR